MDVIVYEMAYQMELPETSTIVCTQMKEQDFDVYRNIYNSCFYEMRKALEIQPYDFLHSYAQIAEKIQDIYLLVDNNDIIGSVACYGNEVDDLIVNPKYQKQGYGKQLLLWAMEQIRAKNQELITLHVAEWNQNAVSLYKKIGFEVINVIKVR